MKRILLASALLLASVSLFAAKPLKVTGGSIDVLKESSAAIYVIDLSQATFEGEKDFKTWCEGDYDTRVTTMNETFLEKFNQYSKGMKVQKDGDAPYKLVFKVKEFERKMGGTMGQFFMKVYGTIVITDKAGETVCEIEVDGVRGNPDFVENDRFPKVIDGLCRELSKLK